VEIGVLSDQCNGHRVVQAVLGESKSFPLLPEVLALPDVGCRDVELVKSHSGGEKLDQLLIIQENGHMVGRVDIVNRDYLLIINIAEERDFLDGRRVKRLWAAAGNLLSER